MNKIATFTGHRQLKHGAREDITWLLRQVPNHTIRIGMAVGADLLCAEICVDLSIPFEAWIPCPRQHRNPRTAERCDRLTELAVSSFLVSSENYHKGTMHQRNLAMLKGSKTCLAYWDGSSTGGTASTVKKARQRNVSVIYRCGDHQSEGIQLTLF